MNRIKGFISLTRPMNCFMTAFAVLVGFLVSAGGFAFGLPVLALMISGFFVCGAGQTVNDIADYRIDKRIKPSRVLPKKIVSLKEAKYFAFSLFAAGNILALTIGLQAVVISAAFSALLIIYSFYLKPFKFLGNAVIALGSAVPLIYGATITGNYLLVLYFAAAAFFASYSREIIKDFEDLKLGEKEKKSLPSMNQCYAKIIVYLSYSSSVLIAFISADLFRLKYAYIVLVLIASIFFVLSGRLTALNLFEEAQKHSKTGMLIALLAFLSVIL